MEKIKEVSFWVLGNGRKINFWYDKWIDNLKIGDFVKIIPQDLQNLRVANLINWDKRC